MAVKKGHLKQRGGSHVEDGTDAMPPGAPDLRAMLAKGVPKILLRLAFILLTHNELNTWGDLDAVEYFAGCRCITFAMRALGYRAMPFELNLSRRMNMESDIGFALAIMMLLRLEARGLLWLAPVCSSWVWMNLGTSKRNKIAIFGDCDYHYVRAANLQVARVCLLLEWACAMGIYWALEQPISSLLEFHPRYQALLAKHLVYVFTVELGAYGANSLKRIKIYTNAKWLCELGTATVPRGTTFLNSGTVAIKYVDSKGETKVKGGPDLRATQAYPPRFGIAIAALYAQNARPAEHASACTETRSQLRKVLKMSSQDDAWEDANLAGVFTYLRT